MPLQNQNIPPRLRAATVLTNSFNEQDNTIEVVAATDAKVLQASWDGLMEEILSMDSSHVRMDRMNAGAPALDNHQKYGSIRDSVVGVVVSARLEPGKLICKIQFSERADLKDFINDVKKGIHRNISIGYRVYKYEITDEAEKIPVYRAVDWEPFEVSFVSIPADYTAGVRSTDTNSNNSVEIISTNSNKINMKRTSEILQLVRAAGLSIEFAEKLINDETITVDQARTMVDAEKAKTPTPAAAAPTPAADPASVETRAAETKADQKRSSEILNACRAAGFDIAYAETLINDDKMTVDGARAAIIQKLAAGRSQEGNTQANNAGVIITSEAGERFRKDATTGMVLRSGHIAETKFKPEELPSARNFQQTSLLRFAAICLERAGISTAGLSDMEIARRAITSSTSDFTVVLENVMHKVLLSAYGTVPDTWRRFCKVGSVNDFRVHNRYRPGSLTRLDKVNENGELKNKAIPDVTKESIQASTYGNIININRQTVVNDDLGHFTSLAADFGRAAARGIEIDVYALLALNSGNGPNMTDGNPLFHASHGNLITGAAPSVASFDAIKVAMKSQKDHSGNDYLDLSPEILVLASAQAAAADAINDSMYDPDASNKFQKKNTSYKTFKDIVDTPRISGNAQYAFANVDVAAVLEVAFLNGIQTPYFERQDAFEQLGTMWRMYFDYGVGAIDWKGAIKNPGA